MLTKEVSVLRTIRSIIARSASLAAILLCTTRAAPPKIGRNGSAHGATASAARRSSPTSSPRSGPRQLWGKQVGIGHSSPVADDGRVYLFHLVGRQDILTCFDADSGHVIWNQTYNGGWAGNYKGTRATPAIDKATRIYTLAARASRLPRADTGKPLWALDALKATGCQPLEWGQASSPLIVGDRVFVQGGDGGARVAVDKNDGQVAWQSQAQGAAGMPTSIQVDVGGQPQLIVFGGAPIFGPTRRPAARSGSEPWQTSYDVNAATPVYRDGHALRHQRVRPRLHDAPALP